jgi:hypothetical protein
MEEVTSCSPPPPFRGGTRWYFSRSSSKIEGNSSLQKRYALEVNATAVFRVYWYSCCEAAIAPSISQHKVLSRVPGTQLGQTHFEFQLASGPSSSVEMQPKCQRTQRDSFPVFKQYKTFRRRGSDDK